MSDMIDKLIRGYEETGSAIRTLDERIWKLEIRSTTLQRELEKREGQEMTKPEEGTVSSGAEDLKLRVSALEEDMKIVLGLVNSHEERLSKMETKSDIAEMRRGKLLAILTHNNESWVRLVDYEKLYGEKLERVRSRFSVVTKHE